jgi:hypothetical protein
MTEHDQHDRAIYLEAATLEMGAALQAARASMLRELQSCVSILWAGVGATPTSREAHAYNKSLDLLHSLSIELGVDNG